MTLKELAQVLKDRQISKKLLPLDLILSLSDEEIIDSYMKCSSCQSYMYTAEEFALAAERSSNYNEFFEELDKIAGPRHKFKCN